MLTAEDLELAGGADAFFWVQEIGDVIFARMEGRSYPADCTVPLDQLRYVRVLHVEENSPEAILKVLKEGLRTEAQ